MATLTFVDAVSLSKIFLQLDNPRHEPVRSEADAIAKLCDTEDVLPLARDIVRYGLSPLERFAMVPVGGKKGAGKQSASYIVAEGNRRICALKLLSDPDLAPPALRKAFEKLADNWTPIITVPAAVFNSPEEVRIWLDRVHSGPQGGIGRKGWNSDQKQRFWGGTKNRLAQMLLDYAESEGMITEEQRAGKLTTAQRFLSNPIFRENLGLDSSNDEELSRTRPKRDFDTLVKKFVADLVGGKAVNSRMNKDDIQNYARGLASTNGVSGDRTASEPVAGAVTPAKKRPRRKPIKPKHARTIQYEDDIAAALKAYNNGKLESLYYSVTAIELESHTPLVCVGVWALFEALTACMGRNDNTSFNDYLSKQKITSLGMAGDSRALRSAIARVSEYGNITKHHPVALTLNGDQLNNDVIALKEVVLKCIDAAVAAKP